MNHSASTASPCNENSPRKATSRSQAARQTSIAPGVFSTFVNAFACNENAAPGPSSVSRLIQWPAIMSEILRFTGWSALPKRVWKPLSRNHFAKRLTRP